MKSHRLGAIGLSLALGLGLTTGVSSIAYAKVADTYITSWQAGKTSAVRAATKNVKQKWHFLGKSKVASSKYGSLQYAQMELQTPGAWWSWTSLGAKNLKSGPYASPGDWGKRTAGVKHRYQFNGTKMSKKKGLWLKPYLSNKDLYITY